jgi:hypothetical protein
LSQFILDEQLALDEVLLPIHKWASVKRIDELRPGEVLKDDRIPSVLHKIKHSTFVTIDGGFWKSHYCHPQYCILYFALRDDQQEQLPELLRKLCQLDEFKTRKARMGKVVKVTRSKIECWERGISVPKTLPIILKR